MNERSFDMGLPAQRKICTRKLRIFFGMNYEMMCYVYALRYHLHHMHRVIKNSWRLAGNDEICK